MCASKKKQTAKKNSDQNKAKITAKSKIIK